MTELIPIGLLFLVGLLASFYGTTAGGGGLLTVSALLLLGLSAQQAVATTIAGVLAMSVTGLILFHQANKIEYGLSFRLIPIATIGAFIGSFVLLNIPDNLLRLTLATAFTCILASVFWHKHLGTQKRNITGRRNTVGYILFFLIGMYTSIINAGAAILANYTLTTCFGLTYLESAAARKLIFIIPLFTTAVIYANSQIIHWPYAMTLFAAQIIGTYIGTHYALKKGDLWVRWLFMIVIVLSVAKLLFT